MRLSGASVGGGPLRRLVLFASGVNWNVLRAVPIAEDTFLVLGSAVLISGAVSAVFGTVASSLWSRGELAFSWTVVGVGLHIGLLIASIDRLLVRAPLNPYRFPPDVTSAIRAGR